MRSRLSPGHATHPSPLLLLPLALAVNACTSIDTCGGLNSDGVRLRCSIAEFTSTSDATTGNLTDVPTSSGSAATTERHDGRHHDRRHHVRRALGEPTYGQACAPDDGAAVEFKIGLALRECSADFPQGAAILRIVLFQGVPLAPGVYNLDGGEGSAYYDDGDGMPMTGDIGVVTITDMTADGLVGSYDVTLTDNTQLAGSLDALYCPVDVACG
jgi:hypothetical protein